LTNSSPRGLHRDRSGLYDAAMPEIDLVTPDGRRLHAYSVGDGPHVVMWHHGTPNIGTPPVPLYDAAQRLGIRFLGYDRPGYGGSSPQPGRVVADAAADAAAVADAWDVDRFHVFGHSGGGPHALACAALLPDRVGAAVSISGLAPFTGNDWFAGMGPSSEASLRAAAEGRPAKEAHEAQAAKAAHETQAANGARETQEAPPAEPDFIPADYAAFDGAWGWFGSVVGPAVAGGPAALIDDDLAYVRPWGFEPRNGPTLLVHGTADRMVPAHHSERLAHRIPTAELRLIEGAGHISVLPAAAVPALEWLSDQS
jgi:pimeloyl-ACP methyl ester carboxylesterase